MAVKQEFRFSSADGSATLYGCTWAPEGAQPKAILQLVHGISEHAGRYDDLAEFFAANGWLVTAEDHLGHGHTPLRDEDVGYTADKDGWIKMTDNVKALQNHISAQYPDLPYLMLGHSMGSFLARSFLIRYPSSVVACVLMGTGQLPGAVLSAGLCACAIEGKRLGKRSHSPLLQTLCFGAYNNHFKPTRTPCDWISSVPEEVDRYVADPYCRVKASVTLMADMLGGIKFNQRKDNLRCMNSNTPILFISGEADPVGGNGKGVTQAYQSFLANGCTDVTLKLYPNARHEIHHEWNKEEVCQFLLDWLNAKLP